MKKIFVLILFFLISTNAIAGCEDPINDGVDYTNCRFSDGPRFTRQLSTKLKIIFYKFYSGKL